MLKIPMRPNVLIVTQQLIIAADLYIQLTKRKIHLLGICNSSKDALAAIKEHQPDLVIIDAGLKGAIDGIQLGRLVSHNLDTPYMFLNPGLNEQRLNLAVVAGASAIVNIPLDIEKIEKQIHRIARSCKTEILPNTNFYRSETNPYRSDIQNGFHLTLA